MKQKEKIRQILSEIKTCDTITRIAIFDFDGTLIDTPIKDSGKTLYEQKKGLSFSGWWGRPESLDMEVFDMKPIDSVINDYKVERERSDTLVIMLTGRIPKLSKEVKKILDANDIKFDRYFFNDMGETLKFKITILDQLIKEYPKVESIVMWDDRDEHIPAFKEWGAKQEGINFHITHVEGNHHGPQ